MSVDAKDIISFEKIVEMARVINEIEILDKTRLSVEYRLPKDIHFKLDEDLYYRGEKKDKFKHTKVIEVDIGGVFFKFIEE